MEVVYERVAAIDVGKKEIAVTVRVPGPGPGTRTQQTRKFRGASTTCNSRSYLAIVFGPSGRRSVKIWSIHGVDLAGTHS